MKRVAVAAFSGVLLAASFPDLDLGWPAWLALAPLIALVLTSPSNWRSCAEGLAFGLAYQGVVFTWWYRLLVDYGRLSYPEAAFVYLLLVFYLSLYPAIFAVMARIIRVRRGPSVLLVAAPVLWTALEFARGRLLTGVPWALLGSSQAGIRWAIQPADLGGVYMVSCLVACGGGLLAWIWARWSASRDPGREAPASWPAAILAVAVAAGIAYGAATAGSLPGSGASLRAGLIQGNVKQSEKWDPSRRLRILNAHLAATARVAGEGATLAVWPESSVPLPITSEPSYRKMLEETGEREKVDLLVGSVHWEQEAAGGQRVYNSAFVLPSDPGGESQRYDKIKLVPFGEYVPLRRFLTPVKKLVEEASDFSAGSRPRVLVGGGARLGPLICYEAIFPELARQFVGEGAELLVNITNDDFLGDTAGPRQHLNFSSIRAVENRRWMLRAANTGISALIDPAGRIVDSIPYGRAGEIVREAPRLSGLTIYTRFGDWFSWTCVLLSLLALLFPIKRGRRETARA